MRPIEFIRSVFAYGRRVAINAQPAIAFITRLVIGYAFVQSGTGKWKHFSNTVAFFASIKIPFPVANAAFIASLECIAGVLLIVGLATRLSSALLSSTMVVALLTADRGAFVDAVLGRGDGTITDVVPFVFLLFLAWLVAFGAGRLSIDQWLTTRSERRKTRRRLADPLAPLTPAGELRRAQDNPLVTKTPRGVAHVS